MLAPHWQFVTFCATSKAKEEFFFLTYIVPPKYTLAAASPTLAQTLGA